jgi:hypothetical protein
MQKEGFIYIWYDRKRKMYYIGCHWGTIDDGYICSSNRMRDAYRRRPHDFKRRIIQRGIEQEALLEEEYKWLSKIDTDALGKKYYNISTRHFGHWSTNPRTRLTVGQKISNAPNRARNIGLANSGKKRTEEFKAHLSKVNSGRIVSEETKKKLSLVGKGRKHTEDAKRKMSIRAKQAIRKPASEETKRRMSESHKARYRKLKEVCK